MAEDGNVGARITEVRWHERDENGEYTKVTATDENGNSTTYEIEYDRDEDGRAVVRDTDDLSRFFDRVGDDVMRVDDDGYLTNTYATDGYGNVTRETAYGHGELQGFDGNVERGPAHAEYEYDGEGNATKITLTDSSGGTTVREIERDDEGNVVKTITTGPDGETAVTTAEKTVVGDDGSVTVTKLDYDDRGDVTLVKTTIVDAEGAKVETESAGATETTREFDADGNVTKETVAETDGATTTREFDVDGAVAKETVTDADGNVTARTFERDADGAVTKETVTDADGNVTKETTFSSGVADETREYERDADGNVTRIVDTDIHGFETTHVFERDADGNVTKETIGAKTGAITGLDGNAERGPASMELEYDVDGAAARITLTDARGETTVREIERDDEGNVTRTVTVGPDGETTVTTAEKTVVDDEGNVTTTKLGYDDLGNVTLEKTTTVDAEGKTTETERHSVSTTTREFDADGRLTKETHEVTDPDAARCCRDRETTYEYDDGNLRRTTTKFSDGTSETMEVRRGEDGSFGIATKEYDADGNMTKETVKDLYGNVTKETVAGADGSVTTREFDADGNVTKETVAGADGSVTTREFDADGNVTKEAVADAESDAAADGEDERDEGFAAETIGDAVFSFADGLEVVPGDPADVEGEPDVGAFPFADRADDADWREHDDADAENDETERRDEDCAWESDRVD